MSLINAKPHFFLWLSIPLILLIGFNDHETIDINIHDTYFVITGWHLAVLISFLFAVQGLVYWGVIKAGLHPIWWMTITHLVCTIDALFIIWLILLFDWFAHADAPSLWGLSGQGIILFFLILLFLLGQGLFILNLVLTIFLNKK